MQRDPDDADHDEVRRIIQIEKPLHAFPLAALPVITHQDRDGQDLSPLRHLLVLADEDQRRAERQRPHDAGQIAQVR